MDDGIKLRIKAIDVSGVQGRTDYAHAHGRENTGFEDG